MLNKHSTHCPIAFGLNIFGDRWTLLILRDILFQDKKYYNEFLHSEEEISTNILADRLEQLEAQRILKKSPDPLNRKRFTYAPTTKGLDLIPVILAIVRWSGKHDPETAAPRPFLRKLEKPANAIERDIRRKFSLRT
ncbi:MAG: helix-turn-helix transcriptional regulator [Leptospirales bacterium]|nr:helix-turn-helix transcriptional regulator [Leptospirales bacterium]